MNGAVSSNWQEISACPACGADRARDRGSLPGRYYLFFGTVIPLPEQGIELRECQACNLLYKTVVPTRAYLAETFSGAAGKAWNDAYDFQVERRYILPLIGTDHFDLLDVGPSNGALLSAFADLGGRRSGLDVVAHPGVEQYLRGEFVNSLLDEEALSWSEDPYDVVTAYDVFEHFYRPDAAFRNLSRLLRPGGIAVLETGHAGSRTAVSSGISNWRYVNLFEHHVFWTPRSIAFHAQRHGFLVERMQTVRHKGWRARSVRYKVRQLVKYLLWAGAPGLYRRLAETHGEEGSTAPMLPFARDHILAVIRKQV